jgi:hypothetical protein
MESEKVRNTIQEIGTKLALHIDQQGHFLELVTELMMGIRKWDSFTAAVRKDFALSDDQHTYVIKCVQENILADIQAELHELYKKLQNEHHEQYERETDSESEPPVQSADTEQPKQVEPEQTPSPYKGIDPYREPVN